MKAVLALASLYALVLAHATVSAQALAPARAGPLAPVPAAPAAGFTQRLDASLPLAAEFIDSAGRPVRLADEITRRPQRPTLLMLGYHRCPQLCGLATQGVLEALRQSGLPPSATRVLFVSVDPGETAADAAARRQVDLRYASLLAGAATADAPEVERLVGAPASIAALARSVGFAYRPGDAAARFSHPAGVVVVTPDGRVSRYLMGVRFDARELRDAVADAGVGRIGTLSDRLTLLCAHLDPRAGLHSDAVLIFMRVAGLATLGLLALFARRRREPR
jgi:protein SCO1/2